MNKYIINFLDLGNAVQLIVIKEYTFIDAIVSFTKATGLSEGRILQIIRGN